MAILATLTMTLPAAAIIHGRTTSTKVMIFGLVVGGICSVIACIGGNLVVTPIYTGMSTDAVIGLILPALLPFNIVKVLINGIVCALIGKSALRALNVFSPHA